MAPFDFFFLLHDLVEEMVGCLLWWNIEAWVFSGNSLSKSCTFWILFEYNYVGLLLHIHLFTFDIFCLYRTQNLHWHTVDFDFFVIHKGNENNIFYLLFKTNSCSRFIESSLTTAYALPRSNMWQWDLANLYLEKSAALITSQQRSGLASSVAILYI